MIVLSSIGVFCIIDINGTGTLEPMLLRANFYAFGLRNARLRAFGKRSEQIDNSVKGTL